MQGKGFKAGLKGRKPGKNKLAANLSSSTARMIVTLITDGQAMFRLFCRQPFGCSACCKWRNEEALPGMSACVIFEGNYFYFVIDALFWLLQHMAGVPSQVNASAGMNPSCAHAEH